MISFVTATRRHAYKSEWVRWTSITEPRKTRWVDKVRVMEIRGQIHLSVVMAYCQVDVTHYVMDTHLV